MACKPRPAEASTWRSQPFRWIAPTASRRSTSFHCSIDRRPPDNLQRENSRADAELYRLLRTGRRGLNVSWVEVIAGVAEFAGHLDHATLHHMIAVVLRKTAQHRRH